MLALSYKNLSTQQKEQILAQMGLIASENTIQSELLQTTLAQKGVSAEKSKAILIELGLMNQQTGELLTQKACTKADLEAILAQKGITGAQAEGIISALGLSGANAGLTTSFGLLGKAIWGVTKALLSNPITWIIASFAGLVAITDAVTTSTEEYKEQLDDLKSEYNEITSEIQSVNSELQTTIDRMKELEGKDSLTFTEKEEYDNLVKTNNELQRKIDLLELEEKQKNKEKNKTFVDTMVSDTENPFEHEVNPNGKTEGQYQISDNYLTSETGYIEAQFEIRDQLLEDLANAETEKEKERIQKRIDEVEKYLNDKNDEWKNVSDGISYTENPTTEDDKAVNEWLDYIADFQDRMAIAMSKDDASSNAQYKTNTFNRVVDNWQFDDTVQGLQDLGKEGKVTAEMLDDPKYDEFINKLVFLGVIDSADNLEDVALAFNSVADSAENAVDSAGKYGNEIDVSSPTPFLDKLYTEDYEDTFKELTKLAEAGELTPKTLSSTHEYNQLLKTTGVSAKEACEQLYNMIDANTRLSAFSSSMGNVDKAYAEFKTSGYNTIDTLSSMQGAFGDLSYYDKFIQIAGNTKSSTEDIQQAYEKLVSEYVYSTGILDTVNESNKGMIQTQLEQLGITNAEEIVTRALNNEIMSMSEAKAILTQYSLDLSTVTAEEINKLITEGKVSNATAEQIATFALKKKLANGATIKTDGDIANLVQLANVSADVVDMLIKVANIKERLEAGVAEAGTASGRAWLESEIANYNKKINKHLNKKQKTNIDYTGGTATTDAIEKANKSATKSTTKFSQAIDWCAQTLSKLGKSIDLFSAKLESNTNSVKTQIKYYKELLNAQNNIVKGYAKTESKYKSTYNKALKKLSKSDQKKVKDGTYTIEQFSGTTKKSGKKSSAEKRYNNIQNALEARDNYLDAQTDSVNAKNQLQEYAEALASVRWDKATEQAEKLSEKVSLLDTKMSNASGYEAKNKVLKKQLDLQKKILDKQQEAYDDTQSDANSYYKKISSKYKKNKNKDGTIKTKGVTDQTQLKYIKIYNAYVKQLAEDSIKLAQAEEDYKASVKEASITRAENIKADYDNKLALIDAKANELDSQIALAEAKGQVASVEYYKQLGNVSDKRMNELKGEKEALEGQLATLTPYSDEWYEVKRSVIEVDEAIADETVNAVENINKQIEAMKGLTQAKNEYLSGTVGTLDWLEGFTDEEDYYNENGGFSDKGLAVAKGKLTKAGLYEQQAKNIQDNIDKLDEQYKNNQDDANYLKQRLELTQDYQDAMTSWYDEQQSLHDMHINNLKKESEALSDLIDKKKESLEADKSEYDYQKSISEQTEDITDLKKRKAMLEGSTSEEDKAELQKINVELKEKEQDLEDTQYEKQLERMEEGLDGLQERFDDIIEKLDEEGAIPSVEEITSIVSNNEKNVEKGIKQIIKDAGLDSLLGEKGLGGLNTTAEQLLTTPISDVSTRIDMTNTWLEKVYNATISNNGSNGDNNSSNSSNSSTPSTTTDTEKNSGTSLFSSVSNQVSLLVQRKAKEFIDNNATKANKKKSEYGILNQKIYEITNGKILNKANRVKLAKLLGINDTDGNGDITGVEAQKVVKLLEKAGFSSGGIVDVVRRNGDDGLATLKVGEAVLTPVQTTALMELAGKLQPLNNFIDVIQKPNLPAIQSGVGGTSTTIDNVSFEFNLPNVVDSDSLIKTIQTDTRVQRTLQNATVGKLNGNTKFGVNRL